MERARVGLSRIVEGSKDMQESTERVRGGMRVMGGEDKGSVRKLIRLGIRRRRRALGRSVRVQRGSWGANREESSRRLRAGEGVVRVHSVSRRCMSSNGMRPACRSSSRQGKARECSSLGRRGVQRLL
jgi:hypothetical protein